MLGLARIKGRRLDGQLALNEAPESDIDCSCCLERFLSSLTVTIHKYEYAPS